MFRWSTELTGTYQTPGFGGTRNCSLTYPNVHFTLYLPQKIGKYKKGLGSETLDIEIEALNDEEYEVEYREGDQYVFIAGHYRTFWEDAEKHCKGKNGHLASITTNLEFSVLQEFHSQHRENAWLGGSDRKVESIWEWTDGTPWVNKSAADCGNVRDVEEHGLKACTHWSYQFPKGGKEKNCLIVDNSFHWKSYGCEHKKLPFWCHISNMRLNGKKNASWKLADIAFSKIELWFIKKAATGKQACSSASKMPGFSMRGSTQSIGEAIISPVFTVTKILEADKKYDDMDKVRTIFDYLNSNLMSTILACREAKMTTQAIWDL